MNQHTKRKITVFLRRNMRWIILFVSIILFFSIAEDILENQIWKFDNEVYTFISKFISNPVTAFFKVVTNLSGAFFIIVLTMLLMLGIKNKKYGKYIIINLASITILNVVLKYIVQRPRPTEFRIINETGYSFPSGHSMVSMAFYGFLIYLVYHYVQNKYLKWALCTSLTLLIPIIGISRIYLGVHYTSDVIGGFCVSIAYLMLYTKIISKQLKNK